MSGKGIIVPLLGMVLVVISIAFLAFTGSIGSDFEVQSVQRGGLAMSIDNHVQFWTKAFDNSIEMIAKRSAYELGLTGGIVGTEVPLWDDVQPKMDQLTTELQKSIYANLPEGSIKSNVLVNFGHAAMSVSYSPGCIADSSIELNYRKSHIIYQTSNAGADYVIKINVVNSNGVDNADTVYTNGNAAIDFGDIRFTSSDKTTELSYWIESISGTTAVFWVRIPGDLSASDQTIYIYYGKTGMITTSDGSRTFEFFQEYKNTPEGTDASALGWDVYRLDGCEKANVVSGLLQISCGCHVTGVAVADGPAEAWIERDFGTTKTIRFGTSFSVQCPGGGTNQLEVLVDGVQKYFTRCCGLPGCTATSCTPASTCVGTLKPFEYSGQKIKFRVWDIDVFENRMAWIFTRKYLSNEPLQGGWVGEVMPMGGWGSETSTAVDPKHFCVIGSNDFAISENLIKSNITFNPFSFNIKVSSNYFRLLEAGRALFDDPALRKIMLVDKRIDLLKPAFKTMFNELTLETKILPDNLVEFTIYDKNCIWTHDYYCMAPLKFGETWTLFALSGDKLPFDYQKLKFKVDIQNPVDVIPPKVTYTFNVNSPGTGTVRVTSTSLPPQSFETSRAITFDYDETISVSATPKVGYDFIKFIERYGTTTKETTDNPNGPFQATVDGAIIDAYFALPCTPNWQCTAWSTCIAGAQTRTCSDQNSCGDNTGKPTETQTCTCIPDWQCTAWSACVGGTQTRTCSDQNICGTNSGKPIESQTCTVCIPDWQCTAWSTCIAGAQTRTCSDQNSCGDNTGKPTESQTCTVCTPDWQCTDWDVCISGTQWRTCTDQNSCDDNTGMPPESQTCTCIPDWQCTAWSACIAGNQWRTCTDQNSCGDNTGMPSETQTCIVCIPDWQCTAWSACSGGTQWRTCTDQNSCGDNSGKPAETNSCSACIPNWQCTAWSTCIAGAQTRTCSDQNSCGDNTGKPTESQTCCTPNCASKACGASNGCGGICLSGSCTDSTRSCPASCTISTGFEHVPASSTTSCSNTCNNGVCSACTAPSCSYTDKKCTWGCKDSTRCYTGTSCSSVTLKCKVCSTDLTCSQSKTVPDKCYKEGQTIPALVDSLVCTCGWCPACWKGYTFAVTACSACTGNCCNPLGSCPDGSRECGCGGSNTCQSGSTKAGCWLMPCSTGGCTYTP